MAKTFRDELDELRSTLGVSGNSLEKVRGSVGVLAEKVDIIWNKIFKRNSMPTADVMTNSDIVRGTAVHAFSEGADPVVDATGAGMSGYPETFGDVDAHLFVTNAGVLKFGADTIGTVRAGSDASAAATTAWVVFSVDQTYNSESMGAGDMLLGDNSTSKANILWDASLGQLKFRSGTTTASYVDTDGTLVTVDASIGGWIVDATSIKDLAGVVGLSSAVTGGDDIRFWAGHATPGSAAFRVTESGALVATSATITGSITATSGDIGGWTIDADEIKKLTANVGITLDSATPIIKVGDTGGTHIQIDGANQRIRSSNFSAGAAGFNISATTGDAEFNNIVARGNFKTAVFEKDTISVVGGDMLILPGDSLAADMTALDASTLTVLGETTFAVNDILRMKDGLNDEWLQVTSVASAPTYTVTRDKAGAYAADNNPVWKKGQAVANYMQSGDGGVKIESGATPKISCFTHAGAPWTTITEQSYLSELGVRAGAGAVTLDEDGISIEATTTVTTPNSVKFVSGTDIVSYLCCISPPTLNKLFITAEGISGKDTAISLVAEKYSGMNSQIILQADNNILIVNDGQTILNNGGLDADTIIKGDTTTIATFDAGLDAMGIGGAAESGKVLKVTGATSLDGAVTINDSGADADTIIKGDAVTIATFYAGLGTQKNELGMVINNSSADSDTVIRGYTDTNLFRVDASVNRVGIGTATPATKLDVAGALTVSGGITNTYGNVTSAQVVMNDDTATSFLPTKASGIIIFGTQDNTAWGMIFYNTTSPSTVALNVGSNTNVTTGSLAGTTGTDTKFTVSAHATDGKLYFENRRGAARTLYVTMI